jgi:DNA-binding transcriptional LysR family regulator
MNLNRIDLNLFVVFETIYAERNLTRASEALSLTQPAVSNALARLRATVGDPLFVRTGRAMAPTPVAHNLIGPVRQALRALRTSVSQRERFEPATAERTFHIALRDAASSVLMPDLMLALRAKAPGLNIHCHQVDRREIALELAAGTLDFAIDIPELAKSDLGSAPLFEDRYVCVLRKGHPMARGALSLERFLAIDHVTISGRRRGRSFVDIALGRLGRQTNTVLRLPHFQPAFHVVMRTDMALSAPLSLAKRYEVAIKELPFEAPPLRSLLFWHRNADLDPANIWLRAEIAKAIRPASTGPVSSSNRGS